MFDPNKRYKMYLVEVGDDDREAVVEANIASITFHYSTDSMSMEADIIGGVTVRNFKEEWNDSGE